MSWDVLIQRYDGVPPSVDAIPDDFRFPSMGDASAVRGLISTACPSVDWSDPAWGILDGDGYSIEFNFQEDGEVDSFMLHVRGGGDAISPIVSLCKTNGWVALDTSTGDFMDLESPSDDGWKEFQAFRDQVVASAAPLPWYRRLLRAWRG